MFQMKVPQTPNLRYGFVFQCLNEDMKPQAASWRGVRLLSAPWGRYGRVILSVGGKHIPSNCPIAMQKTSFSGICKSPYSIHVTMPLVYIRP